MDSKCLSHLINIGVGTGNCEVISIRVGEKIVGLGNVEAKKLKKVGDIQAN